MRKIGLFKAMKQCRDYSKMDNSSREKLRNQRLKDIVAYARENSPYYQKLYRDLPESFDLSDLPSTNKKELMERWDQWVCDRDLTLNEIEQFMEEKENIGRKFKNKVLVFTTSGSTGNPLAAVCDDTTNNVMGAITACRSYARKEDLISFIKRGGKTMGVFADSGFYLANSSVRYRVKTMPWKKKKMAISSALYPIEKIVQQLNEFQPAMLGGYPSNLELLIEEAKSGRLNISPVIIMTGGEYLSFELREKLKEAFHCYVQTSYSCTEGGTVACECVNQHFHINDDWIIVEAVDKNGHPVKDGVKSDKIYLTNLYNYTQPFIRYEISDRVIMHHEPCGCGNCSPWIELEGRNDDVTVFNQGTNQIQVAPLALYAVLKEVHEIRRFQVVVYPENKIELRIEENRAENKIEVFEKTKVILKHYLKSLGIEQVFIFLSDKLPEQDAKSGKFKHVINRQKDNG